MKYPRVVVYERDGRLAQILTEPVHARGWALREPRQSDTLRRELHGGCPTVLVLKIGAKLEQELSLVEQAHCQSADVRIVVVGDVENEALASLAWTLGASFVLVPPLPRELLPEVVLRLMEAAIQSASPATRAARQAGTPDAGAAHEESGRD